MNELSFEKMEIFAKKTMTFIFMLIVGFLVFLFLKFIASGPSLQEWIGCLTCSSLSYIAYLSDIKS